MAKQLVNPIERHVEKAVLGLTGLALVAVIALYLVTSPNQLDLGQEKVSPATIDGKVAQKAADALVKLRSAQPRAEKYEPKFDEFAGSLEPLGRTPLPAAVAMGPEVPIVDPIGAIIGQAGLATVNRPAKLTITHGRGTISDTTGGQTRYVPIDWVTISALFDVKAQAELQRLEYGPLYQDVVFAPPEVQRRARRPDGSWSDEDWKVVKCRPAANVPPEPPITLLSDGGKVVADKEELRALEKFFADLQHSKMQLDVIRPMPPEFAPPTRWALPVITSYRDVSKQDDEYINPAEAPAADPVDRYGLSGETTRKKEKVDLTPDDQRARNLKDAQQLLTTAKQNKSENDAVKAFNIAQDILVDRAASAADKDKAKTLKEEAEQVQRDIKRAGLMGNPPPAADKDKPAGTPSKKRERLLAQQIWAHDAGIGSLVNGETYQYRMRFRVYNPLAGKPDKFSKPENAASIIIAGEWSGPSDPVWIEPATRFFLAGDDQKSEEVTVEFFQWFGGVWVKPPRRIKAGMGETIRDRQRTQAPAVDNANVVDNPEVDFMADAVVVDIDFVRPFRERKPGTTPKGVKFGTPPAPSCSMVYVDSQGRLHERFVSLDKVHPDKREMTSRLWPVPKQR